MSETPRCREPRALAFSTCPNASLTSHASAEHGDKDHGGMLTLPASLDLTSQTQLWDQSLFLRHFGEAPKCRAPVGPLR